MAESLPGTQCIWALNRIRNRASFKVQRTGPSDELFNLTVTSVLCVPSGASSVLQSPDGNWIALHSSQLSRPSLLTKRKSLVFSVLEKESGVISAYDEMGSDSEQDDEGGWGAALRQFRRKLSDETYYTDSQHDPEWTYTQHLPITSPSSGQYTNTETVNSDSEASSVRSACPRKAAPNLLRKKAAPDAHLHPQNPQHPQHPQHQPLYHHQHHQQQHLQQNLGPHPVHSEALDVNFNPKVGCRPPSGGTSCLTAAEVKADLQLIAEEFNNLLSSLLSSDQISSIVASRKHQESADLFRAVTAFGKIFFFFFQL